MRLAPDASLQAVERCVEDGLMRECRAYNQRKPLVTGEEAFQFCMQAACLTLPAGLAGLPSSNKPGMCPAPGRLVGHLSRLSACTGGSKRSKGRIMFEQE